MIFHIIGAMIAGAVSSLIITHTMAKHLMCRLDKLARNHMNKILEAVKKI